MEVGVYAAKNRLSELIRRVQDGEDVTIIDERAGGIPLARIVAPDPVSDALIVGRTTTGHASSEAMEAYVERIFEVAREALSVANKRRTNDSQQAQPR